MMDFQSPIKASIVINLMEEVEGTIQGRTEHNRVSIESSFIPRVGDSLYIKDLRQDLQDPCESFVVYEVQMRVFQGKIDQIDVMCK